MSNEWEQLQSTNNAGFLEKWSGTSINYSFLQILPDYYLNGSGYASWYDDVVDTTEGFVSFTSSQSDAIFYILEPSTSTKVSSNYSSNLDFRVSFSDVIDFTFTEQTQSGNSVGDLTFVNSALDPAGDEGRAFFPDADLFGNYSGDTLIDKDNPINADSNLDLGEAGFWVQMHELGHAFGGLKDVHLTSLNNTEFNNQKYTMMSYNEYGQMISIGNEVSGSGVYASGLMLLDIAALQDTYGSTNTDTRDTDTTYALGDGLGFDGASASDAFLYTIWDGGDDLGSGGSGDTIDVSGFNSLGFGAEIDLRPGHFSSIGADGNGNSWAWDVAAQTGIDPDPGNVAIAFGTDIENAIGTDHYDHIIGNDLDNRITGGKGNDILEGGAGVDTYVFSSGDGTDTIVDDWLESTNIILDPSADIASLVFSPSGDDFHILNGADEIILQDFNATSGAQFPSLTLGSGGNELDVISLSSGNNFYNYFGLTPIILGNAGNDRIYGSTNVDSYIFGGTGSDTLYGRAGSDTLIGGTGGDSLFSYYTAGDGDIVVLDGGEHNDFLIFETDNTVSTAHLNADGGTGNDNYTIRAQNLGTTGSLSDISGNDTYVDMAGTLSVIDQGGDDEYRLTVSYNRNLTISDSNGTDRINAYNVQISDISSSQAGDDLILTSSSGTTTIQNYFSSDEFKIETIRLSGTDYIDLGYLATGSDLSVGTTGDDTSLMGDATDNAILGLAGNDIIYGNDGDDLLSGGEGSDTLNGGLGSDTADYRDNLSAVDVELNNGQADEGRNGSWDDTLTSIENVIGTDFSDEIIGDSANNTVHGGGSADISYGKEGNDTLHGEAGNDALYGEHGDDVLYGGDGADTLDGDRWNLSANDSGNDTIYGGDGADNIWGRHGDDTLFGGDGNDIIRGNEGNDTIDGGAGLDKLYGHDGDDILIGGLDHDDMYGGAGADTFKFSDAFVFDEIHDFSLAENDKLDFSDVLTAYDPLTDVLDDFVKITNNGTHSYAKVDQDGGGDSFDQIIKFVNTLLDMNDFTEGQNLII